MASEDGIVLSDADYEQMQKADEYLGQACNALSYCVSYTKGMDAVRNARMRMQSELDREFSRRFALASRRAAQEGGAE